MRRRTLRRTISSRRPILTGSFNTGDTNNDNKLDTTEIWKYGATVMPPFDMTVTVTPGATPISSGTLSYLTLANGDIRVFYLQDANFNDNTAGTDTPEKTFAPAMRGDLKGIVTDGTSLWAVTEGGTDYVYRFAIARDGSGNPTAITQNGL